MSSQAFEDGIAQFRLKNVFNNWGGSTSAFFAYTHLSHDLSSGLLIPLLPLIRASWGLTYLQAGILISAYTITSGIAQFPGGWIGDRFTKQIAVAIGLAGVGTAALAIRLSPTYYAMLFTLVFMVISAGAYHPSASRKSVR